MTRDEARKYIIRHCNPDYPKGKTEWETAINMAIYALGQPERKDIVQKFHDYQVEWLKSHNDIQFDNQTEEMVVRFLHDTANRFILDECSG